MGERIGTKRSHASSEAGYAPDVPLGYRRTEVAVIPEDWGVARLSDCSEIVMGQSPPGRFYNRSGVGRALINGPTEFTESHPVKIQWTTHPIDLCETGDLLIWVRGSSTGRTNYADGTYAIGRGVAAIRANADNHTPYLSYQVILGVSSLVAAATGSTFPSVDGASLRKVRVLLPPLPEQRAIARVLSDMDELIGSLEALIAKKRAIKQAAMQELLTGKTRLPGFGGEWGAVALGDIADIKNGGTPRTGVPSYWGGRIPWCVPTDITASQAKYLVATNRNITSKGLASCGATLLPAELNSGHLADEGWAERPASGGRIVEVSADPMEPGSASFDLIEVATAESAAADAE